MKSLTAIALVLALGAAVSAQAGVVGTMSPAEPVTAARLDLAPSARRQAWRDYLVRSDAAHRLDLDAIAAERGGGPAPDAAPHGDGAKTMPLKQPAGWYAGPEARHVADVIVSFQTPAGGWGKNMPRNGPTRLKGQAVTADPSYVGTIDNDATVTELRFLARAIANGGGQGVAAYRASFDKGVAYLLAAQYPNGGWPQIWPLQGGYHDAVTYNDGAMLAVIALLDDVAQARGEFAFARADQRALAKAAWDRAMACLLATQVSRRGQLTAWGQQYDALTLTPAGARNFEPTALSSAESAGILLYLMSLPDPSPEVRRAVDAGAAWMAKAAIRDKAWGATDPAAGRRLTDQAGAPPLWARYYDIATDRPIYGDRDRTIHDDVNALSLERRNGYAWFTTAGTKVAAAYADWAAGRR